MRIYRRAVSQLRGSLRVWAVGPFTQRFGQLSLLHGGADALLSGRVASVQPGEKQAQMMSGISNIFSFKRRERFDRSNWQHRWQNATVSRMKANPSLFIVTLWWRWSLCLTFPVSRNRVSVWAWYIYMQATTSHPQVWFFRYSASDTWVVSCSQTLYETTRLLFCFARCLNGPTSWNTPQKLSNCAREGEEIV